MEIIRQKIKGWIVEFEFPSKTERTAVRKYKFIINNLYQEKL